MKTICIFLCFCRALASANLSQECQGQVCLSRCCPGGMVGTPSLDCVPSSHSQEDKRGIFGYPGFKSEQFLFLDQEVDYSCQSAHTLWAAEDDANFTIVENGTILGEYPNTGVFPTQPDEYCVADHDFFWYCQPTTQTSTEVFRERAYPIFHVISSVFAIITLIIYYRHETLGSSLFGKMVMCFLASLAGAYFVLSFRDFPLHLPTLCTILGYISQYTLLSMLFWMNALAFRVYVTFRKIQMPTGSNNATKRLILYCLYAQGVPLVLCGLTALADAYGTDPELRPNMGEFRCFLSCHSGITCSHTDNRFIMPMFIYFGSVQMIINITNLVLFLLTSYHLRQQWKHASKINNNKQNFFVLLQISLLVGLPWILELISGQDFSEGGSFALNFIMDLPNLLLGVFLFIVLVGKKTTSQKLQDVLQFPMTEISLSLSTSNSPTFKA